MCGGSGVAAAHLVGAEGVSDVLDKGLGVEGGVCDVA